MEFVSCMQLACTVKFDWTKIFNNGVYFLNGTRYLKITGNIPISDFVVAQIVALRREKLSYRQISERLNVSKSACQRAWKLFEATGQFNHKKPTGRPSAVSNRCKHL